MSKSKDSHSSGGFHQEYIASLRYRNDLPPPDMPPKLLDIPHQGIGRFVTPTFSSNLSRREEPNIDVDAEGGMPIDLVGIPGLHLGDESAIMAPEHPQPVDPADLPLLMTLDQLRNPAPKNTNVSFLRRTQHISVDRTLSINSSASARPHARSTKKEKVSVDDPKHIKKYIQKGFDIAYPESKYTGQDTEARIQGLAPTKAETDAWAKPIHPDNTKLKPVGFFSVLPDINGFPDTGGFMQFKFDKAPVPAVGSKRDKRMDVAILRPSAPEQRVCQEHASKVALHKANPQSYPDPGPVPFDYELLLPEKPEYAKNVRSSMDMSNPDRDSEELYTHEGPDGQKFHRFDRLRRFGTKAQTLNTGSKYTDIAVTLNAGGKTKPQGAYYYPILGKTRVKPDRSRTILEAGLAPGSANGAETEDQIDQMQVTVRDPDDAELYKRAQHRANIDPKFGKTLPPPPEIPEEQEQKQEEQGSPEAEQPAEGEADDEDTRMSDE
ncbi:hypothetical protein N7532_000555 [Penicillium argentinense]|uniref:Paf1 n=1 Tax=Penicillium argentinense TaxID=1131581 RepID=A0A9W9G5H0_9EURO|nr:uncharacterized protein N7532_000555 [Penicillium argentinense]KAJ5112510.1 hypothetical protein N7532_000555 [Penicillium argentinense]